MRIIFDKIQGFIKIYDGNTYLVLYGFQKYDAIYNRIKYLISQENEENEIWGEKGAKEKVLCFK